MDFMSMRWYAVDNDLCGGWAVATVQADKASEFVGYGEGRIVADGFWEEEHAEHVARLHNEWLARQGL